MHPVGRCLLIFVLTLATVTVALAQANSSPSSAPAAQQAHKPQIPPKPPDMVCFGNDPSWSIQFVAGGARYVGMSESDRSWVGDFFWVPSLNTWAWHPTDPQAASRLTAFMHKAACVDPVRNEHFPWTAEVNLPEGDMVGGCCRKLKPGEAVVGPKGYVPQPSQQQ